MGDMNAAGLEAGGAEFGGGGLGGHDHGGGLGPGQGQAPLVEGPTPGREAVGMGAEGQVVDRHHQRTATRRRHRQAGGVDDVTARPHHWVAEPVPGLVAPAVPGEPFHSDARLRQVSEQPLHVAPDPARHRLIQLPGLQRHPQPAHHRVSAARW